MKATYIAVESAEKTKKSIEDELALHPTSVESLN